MVRQSEIKTFTYSGTDEMIDFNAKKIPHVHKDFKATLKLKSGKEISASPPWRKKIWEWWYAARKNEIETGVLIDVCDQILGKNRGGV